MSNTESPKNWVIVTTEEGFYWYGNMIEAPAGWVYLADAAMFQAFDNDLGMPAVAAGRIDQDKTRDSSFYNVKLSRFGEDQITRLPLGGGENTGKIIAIHDCVDLYAQRYTKCV